MKLSSNYRDRRKIPAKYANIGVAGGKNMSPPFNWEDAPEGTKSFAIVMVDRHRIANNFVHWLVIDIAADVTLIEEGASGTEKMPLGSKELNTTYGQSVYGGPRPPAGTGDHPYETTVYALKVEKLDLSENITLDEFQDSIQNKILAKASLTGMFSQ